MPRKRVYQLEAPLPLDSRHVAPPEATADRILNKPSPRIGDGTIKLVTGYISANILL